MKRQKNTPYYDEQLNDCRALQPEEMSPQQRFQEIAHILAQGVLRLRKIQSKSGQEFLKDVCEESSESYARAT